MQIHPVDMSNEIEKAIWYVGASVDLENEEGFFEITKAFWQGGPPPASLDLGRNRQGYGPGRNHKLYIRWQRLAFRREPLQV